MKNIQKSEHVVVIGNGPSIFEHQNGEHIDNDYDRIIRLNHQDETMHPNHTGTRRDIRCINQLIQKQKTHRKTTLPQTYIHSIPLDTLILQRPPNRDLPTEHETLELLREHVNEFRTFERLYLSSKASTGLFSIWYAMKYSEHVTITGFDCYGYRSGLQGHTTGEQYTKGTHDWEGEANIIDGWLDDGLIAELA